ncbi:MAG: ATP-binding protein [Rhodospirillales bacterium]
MPEILDALDEGVSLWDADNRLLSCNARFREAYPSIAAQLVPGVELRTVLRAAGRMGRSSGEDAVRRWLTAQASGGGEGDAGHHERRLDDGRRLLVGGRRTAAGVLVWTVRDVTEQRLTEETLALLTRAVEESPALVTITDLAGRIEYVNPRFGAVTGYAADEVIGRGIAILKSGEMPLRDYRRIWATVAAGKPWRGPLASRRKDGSLYRTRASLSPAGPADGPITHVVCVEEDLTERLAAEEQARVHRQQLNRYLRIATIGEMGATLAHELSQPIAAIVNYCRGALRRLEAGSAAPSVLMEALQAAHDEARRASDILQAVARFVRPAPDDRATADIDGIVRAALRLVDKELRRRRIELILDLAADLPAPAVNAVEVEQIVVNLIRNAIDALSDIRADRRTICVRTAPSVGEAIIVSVEDNGRGFPFDVAERAFDPFFTTKPDGMGMGLAVCRSIVETHGGRIWVEANRGGGAIVRFTLPIRDVRHAAA